MNKNFTPLLVCLFLCVNGYVNAQQLSETYRIDQINGKPKFVKFKEAASISNEAFFKKQLELTNGESFRITRAIEDRKAMIHERHQQFYQGVEVEFGGYIIHKDRNGKIVSMNGNYEEVDGMNMTPSISREAAFDAAVSYVGAKEYMWDKPMFHAHDYQKPKGTLVIVRDDLFSKEAKSVLAYKYDIYASNPISRADVYVNAQTGDVIFDNAKIHHADAVGSAQTRYSGTRTIHTDSFNGDFRLRDSSRGNGIETYDMNNGTNYNNAVDFVDNDNNWTSGEWNNSAKDNAALDAHWGAEMTYDFFFQNYGRNSFDGNGGAIRSYVHFNLIADGSPSNDNAFWDGQVMTYGDGTQLDALTSLDVVAHEIGHGLTQYTADLQYRLESGAMNEGFSDIWAACVENFAAPEKSIWTLGEDLGFSIRSLSDPKSLGQPDTYGGANWVSQNCTPSSFNDWCGVHTNSGVLNHWFYILSEGATGTNDIGSSYDVTGVGINDAALMAYQMLTAYLGLNSDYADARTFGIQVAEDLFGADSPEVIAMTNAWYAVGVGGPYVAGGDYCASFGTNATFEWISNVQIGAFSNASNGSGYTDFTGQTISIETGSTPVSLTPAFSGQTYNEYWKIWIDLNDDKDFDDANELVFDAGSLSSTTVNGNLTVPASAAGITSRMRISMKWDGAQTQCENFDYGEVEDYTVTIAGESSDTQPPSAPGGLSASNITSSSFDVDWNASTDNVGVAGYDVYLDGILDGNTSGTSYSFNGLSASTSYDVAVIATDAAENESSASTISVSTASVGGGGTETLFAHFFESGWDGWQDGGSDCFRYNGANSWEGNFSIRLRDDSGIASAMTSPTYDVTDFDQLDFEFYFYPNSMETGEDFWVRYFDGSSWTTVASYSSGTSFTNGSFFVATVTINRSEFNFPANAQFRIQCDASSNQDQVYIDQVSVVASNGAGFVASNETASIQQLTVPDPNNGLLGLNNGPEFENDLSVFPNPTWDRIHLLTAENLKSVKLFDMSGAEVDEIRFINQHEIDASQLKTGVYILRIETEEETINQRIVKY